MSKFEPRDLNRRHLLGGIGMGTAAAMIPPAAFADEGRAATAQEVVDDSTHVASRMRNGEYAKQINFLLEKARGVMVFPSLLKGGFIFGAEGGTGVLMGRDKESGNWSYPAFFSTGSASWGLQIGVQDSQVMMLLMNDSALYRALDNELEMGADASVAAGRIGKDFEFSTTNMLKDIYFYAETKAGLYAGVSLEGSAFIVREKLNHAYYNSAEANPHSIIMDRRFRKGAAKPLITSVS
ncbi:MAG: lipid-binding SYLF domain-containing protein [Alphaproteobacteria bacterium]